MKSEPIRLHWWDNVPNFGDVLSPWIAEKMSGREVEFAPRGEPAIVSVGSILSHVSDGCVVWGTGSFGTETPRDIAKDADYRAVRGPLTRNRLEIAKVDCPRVFGDPALLVADYYRPDIEPVHEVGVVLRWSESNRFNKLSGGEADGIKKIILRDDDVEKTLDEMLSCKRIVSSSLHGLIIADSYGIPNAWLHSRTPKGGEFKYWDYLLSVDKVRHPTAVALTKPGVTADFLIGNMHFDGRPISIDLDALREACPYAS